MAWNDGLSDGFWTAVSTNVGQAIGAASGTTNHQADAQIAMANQNKADQQQSMSFLQSLLTSGGNNSITRSVPSKNNNQIIIVAIIVIIVIYFAMKEK